jgi:hypothetical protein
MTSKRILFLRIIPETLTHIRSHVKNNSAKIRQIFELIKTGGGSYPSLTLPMTLTLSLFFRNSNQMVVGPEKQIIFRIP